MAWNPFGVMLEVSATAGTVTRISATQFTVVINAKWETFYSGAKTNYGMKATSGGVTKTISAFDGTNRSSGSGSLTGTYSISGNGKQTKTITVTFENFNTDNKDSETESISLSVSVPAWTSYKVTYNANGGSNPPAEQTKYKDQSLTLSNTKPTRTGYAFNGWNTKADGTGTNYAAGATYSTNAAVTLYAKWTANTYTVTYNANGGTGAPGNQTKTYGTTLTLSSTKPTRANYTFKGWGTSAGATTVAYAPGASYTKNEKLTLYAIWELAYTKPRITDFTVTKCDETGVPAKEGKYAFIDFNWACDLAVVSIVLKWKLTTSSTWNTIDLKDYSEGNEYNGWVGTIIGGSFSSVSSYTVEVTVADSNGSTPKKLTLNSLDFTIHAKEGGDGVAFGKTAELADTADFNFQVLLRKALTMQNNLSIMGIDTDGNVYSALMPVTESGNTNLGYGLYDAGKGATHIYGNKINFYTKEGKMYANGNDFVFNTNHGIYGKKPDGTLFEALNPQNAYGNTILGYDNYEQSKGQTNAEGYNTNVYGHDILHGVSNIATPGTYKPYLRRGDEVAITFYGTGFVTNAKAEVHFMIPLSKPIVGTPTISVTSTTGFIIRQANTTNANGTDQGRYTHGSGATTHIFPKNPMTAYAYHAAGVRVVAVFDDTTNAINNAPCGIKFIGTITFS